MKLFFKLSLSLFLSVTVLASCGSIQTSSRANSKKSEIIFITIEFYSKGAGIDFKSKKLLEEFILSYQETNKVVLKYTIAKHGKEGEINYEFTLNQLSKKEKAKFIEALKENIKTAKNIRISQITENKIESTIELEK